MKHLRVENKNRSGHNYVEGNDVIVKCMWGKKLSTYSQA